MVENLFISESVYDNDSWCLSHFYGCSWSYIRWGCANLYFVRAERISLKVKYCVDICWTWAVSRCCCRPRTFSYEDTRATELQNWHKSNELIS